jgi:sulfur carrier protein
LPVDHGPILEVETMEIVCNGKKREVAEGTTLEELIVSLDLDPETVVVECDGTLVDRDEYPGLRLDPGCRLEIIRFVGGG